MLTFRIDGGRVAAGKIAERLKIIHYAVSLGHHRSLVFYLDANELLQTSFKFTASSQYESWKEFAGDGIFRFSAGLEDADDLIADLEQALDI